VLLLPGVLNTSASKPLAVFVAAGCVEDKRIKTVGRVVVAGCVAKRTSPRALKNKTRKFKG